MEYVRSLASLSYCGNHSEASPGDAQLIYLEEDNAGPFSPLSWMLNCNQFNYNIHYNLQDFLLLLLFLATSPYSHIN